MNNSYDLLKIYGIPPAPYSEDNPDDLYLSNLPSLEQIASFNLAMEQRRNPSYGTEAQGVNGVSTSIPTTPATSIMGEAAGMNPTQVGVSIPNTIQETSAGSALVTSNAITQGNNIAQQITDFSNPYPVTAESIQFLNGFIRTQIGRRAQIQFLVGSTDIVEKDGYILGVGANYILINEIGTNDITACDFYNLKFIRFLY